MVDLPPNTTGRIELDTGALGVDPGSLRIETEPVSSKLTITYDGAVVMVVGVQPGPTTARSWSAS